MGRRGKKLKSVKLAGEESDGEERAKPAKSPIKLSSDDDDDGEANEDLSLRIVEKAMLRACTTAENDAFFEEHENGVSVIDLSSPSILGTGDAETNANTNRDDRGEINEVYDPVDDPKDEEMKAGKTMEIVTLTETNPVQRADNAVLRKLLRGPRYFDPPDGGWGTCYNCGEEGHTTVNCTSAKRRRPCYVCGSLEHQAKQCVKAQDCFICKKEGHRAKDCPEKCKGSSKSPKICLKCGHSGHDMFYCRNDYNPEDLKEMQCYICKSFGHLCCANYIDTGPREVSCYKCGQSGHTGLACRKSHGETTDTQSPNLCYKCGEGGHFARECTSLTRASQKSHGETNGTRSLNSCYKCGEDGHFARECTSLNKVAKCNRSLSTPKKRPSREDRGFWEGRSGPYSIGKPLKKKKNQHEENGFSMPPKFKKRGGWITDDPEDYSYSKTKINDLNSPTTPINRSYKTSYWSNGNQASSSHRKPGKLHFGNSASNTSAKIYKHRYSASRFGNPSDGGMRRTNKW